MTVKIGENVIQELDIFAKNDVKKKKVLDYYKDFLTNMNNWMMMGISTLKD